MKELRTWAVAARHPNGVDLRVDGRHVMRLRALEPGLFRVAILKDGAWRLDRSWAIAPGGPGPIEGRSRDRDDGFACPDVRMSDERGVLRLETDALAVEVHTPLRLVWQMRRGDGWTALAEDRPTGAYMLGTRDHRCAHFMACDPTAPVYGLGEKAGPLNRVKRRYEMRNLDALGYDAARTDPLYKHVPFVITRGSGGGWFSTFHDNFATQWFDFDQERDNYHKPYRAWRADDGDIDYYLRAADDLPALVTAQAALTGGTAFPPRWSLGYSGSTMSYTDAPDAFDQLKGFLARLEQEDIPCDSFHLSSGYTSIDGKRYVFNWNRDKFPEPRALGDTFEAAGVHLVPNIKPVLLDDHPRYAEAVAAGLFIRDSDSDEPARLRYWDGEGSHLDFTNRKTFDWWADNVRTALLDNAIPATWNDNNECEVWDSAARCNGFGSEINIGQIRPLTSLLMCRSSDRAQRAHAPGKRPYLVTRSAMSGCQALAQTWTGDNRTSWDTLRWNIPMALGLSLSGFFNIGHDIGGFAGPKPGPELFLRWVQHGIFLPRFSIHSWNDDNTANEPWMYPEITPLIRDAIKLRYCLMPYLYTCLWAAHARGEPMLRPLFFDHPDDPRCRDESPDFLLGRDLLVATVIEQGATERRVWLPANATGWWDVRAGTWHAGGQELRVPVDQASIPFFARGGAVIPLGEGASRADPGAEAARTLWAFPTPEGQVESWLYEDDGVTDGGPYSLLRFTLDADLTLACDQHGTAAPVIGTARVVLPQRESRAIRLGAGLSGDADAVRLPGAQH